MNLSRESKIYVMGNGSQSNVEQHGCCLSWTNKGYEEKTYLTSVNLGNDGHCLYLMCLFCFTNVGRKKKKEREKRCESKGKETTRVMSPNALRMPPNPLVPGEYSRLVSLPQNPMPSPALQLRAYFSSGP